MDSTEISWDGNRHCGTPAGREKDVTGPMWDDDKCCGTPEAFVRTAEMK